MEESTCRDLLRRGGALITRYEDVDFARLQDMAEDRRELCSIINKLFFNAPHPLAIQFPWKRALLAVSNVTCALGDDESFPMSVIGLMISNNDKQTQKEELERVRTRVHHWGAGATLVS